MLVYLIIMGENSLTLILKVGANQRYLTHIPFISNNAVDVNGVSTRPLTLKHHWFRKWKNIDCVCSKAGAVSVPHGSSLRIPVVSHAVCWEGKGLRVSRCRLVTLKREKLYVQ